MLLRLTTARDCLGNFTSHLICLSSPCDLIKKSFIPTIIFGRIHKRESFCYK